MVIVHRNIEECVFFPIKAGSPLGICFPLLGDAHMCMALCPEDLVVEVVVRMSLVRIQSIQRDTP